MEKYILALDASTSKMGMALFKDLGDSGDIVDVSHLELSGSNKEIGDIWEKADSIGKFLAEKFKGINITNVIIEESLPVSSQANTAMLLNKFNALLYPSIFMNMGIKPDYISVDHARRYALPELMGVPLKIAEKQTNKKTNSKKSTKEPNKVLFGAFPKQIGGLDKGKWLKFLIMYLVALRYRGIEIKLNNNLSIDVDNFDSCDAIVAGLGFMIKSGKWSKMADFNFWSESGIMRNSVDDCISIIEKNVAYVKFCSLPEMKALKPDQKRVAKTKYLKEVYKIDDYFNVKL